MKLKDRLVVAFKRIAYSVFLGLVADLINKIAPIILIHYAQRQLGLSSFGHAQFGMAIVDLAIPFISFGYTTLAAIEIGKVNHDRFLIGRIIGNVTFLKVLHASLVFIVLYFILITFPEYHQYRAIVLAYSFILFTSALDTIYAFAGTQKVAFISLVTVMAKIICLLLVIIFVQDPDDGILYGFLTLCANGLISLTTFFVAFKIFNIRKDDLLKIREFFRKSMPYAMLFILQYLLFRYDMVLVEIFSGKESVGLYSGPVALTRALTSLIGAVTMVFFSEMVALKSDEQLKRHADICIWITLAIMLPIAVAIWYFDELLLGILLGETFRQSGHVLSILTTGILFFGFLSVYGVNILPIKNQIKSINGILLMALGIGIILGIVLGARFGMYGVASSVSIAVFISAFLSWYRCRRYFSLVFNKDIINVLLPAVILLMFLLTSKNLPEYWRLISAMAVYLSSFLILNYHRAKMIMTLLVGSKS